MLIKIKTRKKKKFDAKRSNFMKLKFLYLAFPFWMRPLLLDDENNSFF